MVLNKLALFLALSLPSALFAQSYQVTGYIAAHGHPINLAAIDPHLLTRLDYAFLFPLDGQINDKLPYDAANLAALSTLKQQNPSLQVILSVGGATHSDPFSAIAATPGSRALFVASCLTLLQRYNLDGIDIDWEYPSSRHADGTLHPEDKHNYTLLLRDLRLAFDLAEPRLHRHLVTSTATNGKAFFLRNTELGQVALYVDAINLMGYDFYGHGSPTTGNHSALFNDPLDPKPVSDDQCLQAYLAAGVPASKIVLGVPFYGHGWKGVSSLNHGLFQPDLHNSGFDIAFQDILPNLTPGSGFTRYWDAASQVPFLYNPTSGTFISYEDPQSLLLKAQYVRSRHLAGIMFWAINGDSGTTLQNAINQGLGRIP